MTQTRRKRSRGKPVVTGLIVVLVIALIAAVGLYFAYDRYLRSSHPIKYENYVERYARDNHIDKYLVYAVIKTESGFKPKAASNVGARGLMQIMEDTFDWIKFRMDDDDAVYSDMYDPQTNIKYGCFLLGFLYEEFGNVETAMAAYHAGRGQVNEWLADSSISADGVHLDTIPISDTAHYVDKITKAIDVYKKLYS